jgi:hypothetical protein
MALSKKTTRPFSVYVNIPLKTEYQGLNLRSHDITSDMLKSPVKMSAKLATWLLETLLRDLQVPFTKSRASESHSCSGVRVVTHLSADVLPWVAARLHETEIIGFGHEFALWVCGTHPSDPVKIPQSFSQNFIITHKLLQSTAPGFSTGLEGARWAGGSSLLAGGNAATSSTLVQNHAAQPVTGIMTTEEIDSLFNHL